MLLKDKTVVLGVTGGIAAYKALELVSLLKKAGADVKVIMTRSATEFVTPLSFSALTGNPVACDMFKEPADWDIKHISLAKVADVLVIAPCTANVIAKTANGIADDMLTATVLATKAPVLIAPAMNTNMFENPITQDNIARIANRPGYSFAMPDSGRLACGDLGRGKLRDIQDIFDMTCHLALNRDADLTGKKVLVTAGATRESIDPVRFITNHSTGKMGFALANAAYLRGAEVTLIAGAGTCRSMCGVSRHDVVTAAEMRDAVLKYATPADVIIMAAAVSDFKPAEVSDEKIKKDGRDKLQLTLTENPDILKELGEKYGRSEKLLVGFAMETQNLIANAKEKLREKNISFIAANNLKAEGAGFGTDTNVITIIDKDGTLTNIPKSSKSDIANIILDKCRALLN